MSRPAVAATCAPAHARRARWRGHEGFTLIELMVVVLIIAILIAIAIPTFLGARARAADRAAQTNLRNALVSEKIFYADQDQVYTDDPVKMAAIDPAIPFLADNPPAVRGSVYVSWSAAAPSTVMLGLKSGSGTCWYLKDTTAGTTYGSDTGCAAPSVAVIADPRWS